MKKVVITGASGLLGRAIVSEFAKEKWMVLGTALTRATDKLTRVDLTDENETREVICNFKPNVIIHCAAQRSPVVVEKEYEAARILNVKSSKTLAELASVLNAAFIYISTDYVFDGSTPPYAETDEPHPINKYGLTKLEGEKEVMRVNPGSCILRIPVLYGGESYIAESAVSSLIQNLLSGECSDVSNYEVRFPSHTSDIAKICLQLSERKLQDPTLNSIFHWCGSEQLTKYEMVRIIAEEFCVSCEHVKPDNNPSSSAPRPRNTQLSCGRLHSLGIGHHTTFRTGIRGFKKFISQDKD